MKKATFALAALAVALPLLGSGQVASSAATVQPSPATVAKARSAASSDRTLGALSSAMLVSEQKHRTAKRTSSPKTAKGRAAIERARVAALKATVAYGKALAGRDLTRVIVSATEVRALTAYVAEKKAEAKKAPKNAAYKRHLATAERALASAKTIAATTPQGSTPPGATSNPKGTFKLPAVKLASAKCVVTPNPQTGIPSYFIETVHIAKGGVYSNYGSMDKAELVEGGTATWVNGDPRLTWDTDMLVNGKITYNFAPNAFIGPLGTGNSDPKGLWLGERPEFKNSRNAVSCPAKDAPLGTSVTTTF